MCVSVIAMDLAVWGFKCPTQQKQLTCSASLFHLKALEYWLSGWPNPESYRKYDYKFVLFLQIYLNNLCVTVCVFAIDDSDDDREVSRKRTVRQAASKAVSKQREILLGDGGSEDEEHEDQEEPYMDRMYNCTVHWHSSTPNAPCHTVDQ